MNFFSEQRPFVTFNGTLKTQFFSSSNLSFFWLGKHLKPWGQQFRPSQISSSQMKIVQTINPFLCSAFWALFSAWFKIPATNLEGSPENCLKFLILCYQKQWTDPLKTFTLKKSNLIAFLLTWKCLSISLLILDPNKFQQRRSAKCRTKLITIRIDSRKLIDVLQFGA